MNFTPRSVAMGNSMTKAYKLHVKFESGKETFSCLPDTSVGQLKGKIGAKFQVPPSQLVLFCNGKLLQGDDYQTLRQARVCSDDHDDHDDHEDYDDHDDIDDQDDHDDHNDYQTLRQARVCSGSKIL